MVANDPPDVTLTIAGADGPGELHSVPAAHETSADWALPDLSHEGAHTLSIVGQSADDLGDAKVGCSKYPEAGKAEASCEVLNKRTAESVPPDGMRKVAGSERDGVVLDGNSRVLGRPHVQLEQAGTLPAATHAEPLKICMSGTVGQTVAPGLSAYSVIGVSVGSGVTTDVAGSV